MTDKMNNDPLKPTSTLLCKLASIAIHAEELISEKGHPLDIEALKALLKDAEVKGWLSDMSGLALVPVKR